MKQQTVHRRYYLPYYLLHSSCFFFFSPCAVFISVCYDVLITHNTFEISTEDGREIFVLEY